MIKEKLVCPSDKIAVVLRMIRERFAQYPQDSRDGVKVTLPNGWLLVRGSNTEPIIRVITEAGTETDAQNILRDVYQQVRDVIAS
jgi:phosphomannomutase